MVASWPGKSLAEAERIGQANLTEEEEEEIFLPSLSAALTIFFIQKSERVASMAGLRGIIIVIIMNINSWKTMGNCSPGAGYSSERSP